MTTILGVGAGAHDTGAALIKDAEIVTAVNEERFSRVKRESRFPSCAVNHIVSTSDASIDHVALTTLSSPPLVRHGYLELRHLLRGQSSLTDIRKKLSIAAQRVDQEDADIEALEATDLPPHLVADAVRVDHHRAHAASAYYTSGYSEATVVTADAAGHGLSSTVYRGIDGDLTRIATNDYVDSIGRLWAQIPTVFGFKGARHAGKFMGLAAYVTEDVPADLEAKIESFLEVDDLTIRNTFQRKHGGASYEENVAALSDQLAGYDAPMVAKALQQRTSEVLSSFVANAVAETGCSAVALAGGVFANVKANQSIWECDAVRRLFVHPNMGDGGLAVGAALEHSARLRGGLEPVRMPDAYLGPAYGPAAANGAIDRSSTADDYEQESFAESSALAEAVATDLAAGRVVGICRGRMEYGPRALGNRSILFQPTDPTAIEWLNESLDRTTFMPFAPVTRQEAATDCYENVDIERCQPLQYMAITCECTETMTSRSPGAVHVDGTARPQIVDRETNPFLHEVLTCYEQKTGIPTLINTSFNMHGEALVCTPGQAIDAFDRTCLDVVVVGDTCLRDTDEN